MTDDALLAFAEDRYMDALRSGDAGERTSARLLRSLIRAWVEARQKARTQTLGDGGPVDTQSLEMAVATVARYMGAPVGAASSSALLSAATVAYGGARAELASGIAYGVVDEAAVRWLHQGGTYWVGSYYSRALQDAVRQAGEEVLRENLSRSAAGQAFAARISDITGARSAAYWEGLAVGTVTRAQEFGRTEGYVRTGTEAVVIDAVRDARTSCQCRYLDGKRLAVSALVGQRDALIAATDPEAVRTLAPWPTCANVAQLYSEGKIGAPPYHSHCRTRTRVILPTDA